MNKINTVFVIIGITAVVAVSLLTTMNNNSTVYAQQPVNLVNVIEDKYTRTDSDGVPYVKVVYASPNTVLLQGELIVTQFNTPNFTFNSDLWSAMDLLKNQYGFKVEQVMTSGIGSQGNPTFVYILMMKS